MRKDESEEVKANRADVEESVLDTPQESLDHTVWTEDDPPKLVPEAETVVDGVIKWVTERYELPELSVLIIGSITSNSYTTGSDIDIDFCTHFMDDMSEEERSDFGWKMKSDFMENAPEEIKMIGTHPVEIFF